MKDVAREGVLCKILHNLKQKRGRIPAINHIMGSLSTRSIISRIQKTSKFLVMKSKGMTLPLAKKDFTQILTTQEIISHQMII